jgi:hypothetical protein
MTVVLNQPDMEPFEPAKDLMVVVACQDFKSVRHAGALLERIGGDIHAEGRLVCRWWSFECLAMSVLQKLAASHAAEADMILVAAHDGAELPEKVADWISLWLPMGENHSRALVCLLDSDKPKQRASHGILSQLKKVAELGRMDFFATGTQQGGGGRQRERCPWEANHHAFRRKATGIAWRSRGDIKQVNQTRNREETERI